MNEIINLSNWRKPSSCEFIPYLRKVDPPLKTDELDLRLLEGNQRKNLRSHTTGDFSFVLYYEGIEGAVSSFEVQDKDLCVLQIQGAKTKKSYRVDKGIDWILLVANQLELLFTFSSTQLQRLIMPLPFAIPGLIEEMAARENVCHKYLKFASIAGLHLSRNECKYIKYIKS